MIGFGITDMSLIALAFTAISVIIVIVVNEYIGFDFNSAPLQVCLSVYFIIQIIASILLTKFVDSINTSLIAQIIILAVFGILIILLYEGKKYIEKQEKAKN